MFHFCCISLFLSPFSSQPPFHGLVFIHSIIVMYVYHALINALSAHNIWQSDSPSMCHECDDSPSDSVVWERPVWVSSPCHRHAVIVSMRVIPPFCHRERTTCCTRESRSWRRGSECWASPRATCRPSQTTRPGSKWLPFSRCRPWVLNWLWFSAGGCLSVAMACLSWNPEVHPVLGEMVEHATICPCLYMLSYMGNAELPATLAATPGLWRFQCWSFCSVNS